MKLVECSLLLEIMVIVTEDCSNKWHCICIACITKMLNLCVYWIHSKDANCMRAGIGVNVLCLLVATT